jgi:hypothetical protein
MRGLVFIVGLDERVVESTVRIKFGRVAEGDAKRLGG